MAGLSRMDKAHPKVQRSNMFISLGLKFLIFSSSADFGTCDTSGGQSSRNTRICCKLSDTPTGMGVRMDYSYCGAALTSTRGRRMPRSLSWASLYARGPEGGGSRVRERRGRLGAQRERATFRQKPECERAPRTLRSARPP